MEPRVVMKRLSRDITGRTPQHPFYILLIVLLAGGCSFTPRAEIAARLARSGGLRHVEITARPFVLTSFLRLSQKGRPVDVYIEGDGHAWLDRHTPSLDPTPDDPLGLKLAARDDGANVIYLARPCQYSRMAAQTPCPLKYWTFARFSPTVIDAMNHALNVLKRRYGFAKINLIGYSGGGAVAVLLAARRTDVASLRTVAGDIDSAAMQRIHDLSPLTGSLAPEDAARAIARIPQIHFIGGKDTVITPAIYQGYEAMAGQGACVAGRIVSGAHHNSGWAHIWPSLLKMPLPACGVSH